MPVYGILEMKKMKIVIIGGGNAGVWTALHYGYHTRNDKNIEIELIYNPEIDSFPVGQGTLLNALQLLWLACGTDWYHNEIRATPKLGILYENFSKKNKNIYHPFPLDHIAFQADPKYLQKYILNSGWFGVKEGNVTDLDTVDADVIFDCRGNTKTDDIEYESLYSPVNSVLLAVGPSPAKPQLWSRHVATPDGWTFVIPNTTETTSYGYLYNSDITPLETAKTNFRETFPEASESYSGHFDHREEVVNLPFESYMAKEPLRIDSNGRKIILNGNRLAFLEPMESTAIGIYLDVAGMTYNWVVNDEMVHSLCSTNMNKAIYNIYTMIHEIRTFILWHYTNGSVYDTPFWKTAQAETSLMFKEPNETFENIIDIIKSTSNVEVRSIEFFRSHMDYGQWPASSIKLWYDNYINV